MDNDNQILKRATKIDGDKYYTYQRYCDMAIVLEGIGTMASSASGSPILASAFGAAVVGTALLKMHFGKAASRTIENDYVPSNKSIELSRRDIAALDSLNSNSPANVSN